MTTNGSVARPDVQRQEGIGKALTVPLPGGLPYLLVLHPTMVLSGVPGVPTPLEPISADRVAVG
jgi:hypothetical protein